MPLDSSSGKAKRRLVKGLLIFGIPLGAVIYFFVHDPMPDVARPQVAATPHPNAFDTYRRAAAAISQREMFPGFDPRSYERSGSELRKRLEMAVKANDEAYRLVGLGLKQEYVYPINPDMLIVASWQNLTKLKDVAKIIQAKAEWLANQGKFDGAIGASVDGLKLASQVRSSGILVNRLVGIALASIARGRAWSYIDQAGASLAGESARRVIEIESQTRPFSEIARYGFECDRYCLASLLKESKWKSEWQKYAYASNPNSFETTFRNVMDSRRNALESFDFWMQESSGKLAKKFSERGASVPAPLSPIAAVFSLESFDTSWNADLKEETLNLLFATMLAIRAFQLDTKSYPSDLKQLVPKFLTVVPTDPYDPGKQFRYVRIGANYLLYSVGPDGKDNGGTPIARRPKSPYTYIGVDSQGDIVAGFTR